MNKTMDDIVRRIHQPELVGNVQLEHLVSALNQTVDTVRNIMSVDSCDRSENDDYLNCVKEAYIAKFHRQPVISIEHKYTDNYHVLDRCLIRGLFKRCLLIHLRQ